MIHWRLIGGLLGLLLMIYSLSFLPSILLALLFNDGEWRDFALSLAITVVAGFALWLLNPRLRGTLSVRDGFLFVAIFWVLLGFAGAIPLMLGVRLNLTDAVFEAVSAFTTTGATVIVGLDQLPPSILYHRQQMQWLGGMGVIVLAVAILPLLGIGGMQLYRAEASGVTKHEKLTPRIGDTARALWLIYLGLTIACAIAYWIAGMSVFDAIGHAYATVATGGFSTHDASIGYFDSASIEVIAVVFMLAGGVNFAIHFLVWRRRSPRHYLTDPEVRTYLGIFLLATLFIGSSLYATSAYENPTLSFRHAMFQVASILTSTGFGTATFADWPLHVPLVLVVLSFIGGCAGSTAGGIKVMRIMLLARLGLRELFQLAHPRAVSVVKFGDRAVPDEVMFSVWGFYVLYIVTTLLLTTAMMAAGLDLESAFGAVLATINLLGPGLGEVSANFASVDAVVKWLGVLGMLVGRLEVFTLLILFLPAYWRG